MNFLGKKPFNTVAEKRSWAKTLSLHVEGKDLENLPFCPNAGDYDYWKLDSGNDWGLKFYPEVPNGFSLYYRYNCDSFPKEESLAEILKEKYGLKVAGNF